MDKKKQILYFLKNGVSSTTKIANEIKANAGITLRYLEELEQEKKITRTSVPYATYWRLSK